MSEKPLSTDPAAGQPIAGTEGPKMSAARPQRAFGQTEIAFPDRLSPEATRTDNSLFGMPPEVAALSGMAIGRAIGQAGLTAAGRAVAGLKATAVQVTPILKYEATRSALKGLGVPAGLAEVAAATVAALTGGGKGAAAEEVAADAPHLDRSVSVQPSSLTPQQLRERILQGSGTPPVPVRGAAKGPVGMPAEPVPAPVEAPPVQMGVPPNVPPSDARMGELMQKFGGTQAPEKLKMTADMAGEYIKLRAAGKTDGQARAILEAAAALREKLGSPTDAQMQAQIRSRNYKS